MHSNVFFNLFDMPVCTDIRVAVRCGDCHLIEEAYWFVAVGLLIELFATYYLYYEASSDITASLYFLCRPRVSKNSQIIRRSHRCTWRKVSID